LLDQITPWNIDPNFLIDFLHLPNSFFYPNAPQIFGEFQKNYLFILSISIFFKENFIHRYGTHVVVSAKFGGDFKIVHTTKKSKVASVESFAQDCTTEAVSMFSGSWKTSFNALVVNMDINKSNKNTDTQKDDANMARKKQRT
jgi:hypothetical protein